MGPKFYFVTRPADRNPVVGDLVDFSEYIVGGDFNMNPIQSERRPNEVPRGEVLHFVGSVLGVEPGLVRSVTIEGDAIKVDLVTLRIVD